MTDGTTTITELSILNNRNILSDSDSFGFVHGHVNRDKLIATLVPHSDMSHVRSEVIAPSTGIASTCIASTRFHILDLARLLFLFLHFSISCI